MVNVKAVSTLVFAFLARTLTADAAAPDLDRLLAAEPGWSVERWTVEDGLPVNAVTQLVRTRDGYLWIATFDGLARFDGVRFTVFDTAAVPELGSNRIINLFEDDRGGLWIQNELSRLVRFHQGVFQRVTPPELEGDVDNVRGLVAEDGGVWVLSAFGLYRFADGKLHPFITDRLPDPGVRAIHRDRRGRLWIGTEGGLARLDGDQLRTWTAGDTLPPGAVFDLAENEDGDVLVATKEGILRATGDGFEFVEPGWFAILGREGTPPVLCDSDRFQGLTCRLEADGRLYELDHLEALHLRRQVAVRTDAAGGIWVMARDGLYRDGRRLLRPPATLTAFVFDHEGSVWAGTNRAGLFALREQPIRVLGEEHGLATNNVFSLQQDRNGRLWVISIGAEPGEPEISVFDGPAVGHLTCGAPVGAMFDDPRYGVLIGTDRGIYQSDGRDCWFAASIPDVLAFHRTRSDRLVVGTLDGMVLSEPGAPLTGPWHPVHEVGATAFGPVRAIHESPDGTLWLGTNGSGVVRYREGEDALRLTTADGLPSDLIRAFHEDDEGFVWIATEDRGLARLATSPGGGIGIATVSKRDGLFDDSLHKILEDDGWFWISTNRGIFRVRRSDLNAYVDAPHDTPRRLDVVFYNEREGMRNREANGGWQEAGLRAPDGRLYFATQDGVAILDPGELVRDLPPPPVVVERFLVGDREVPIRGEVTLAPGERNFRVEYTALSFRAPEKMRFLYMLEGYDDGWQDAGTDRATHYAKVPPGRYAFRVRARSSDGVWNETAAPLRIAVPPYFWESGWFKAAIGLAVPALLFVLLRYREHRQWQRRRQLEALVAARTAELEREKETVARQAAKQAELDRLKSELFANVSHEFRTPLTLTLGPLEEIREGRYGPISSEMARQLDLARRNTTRVLELVNQLLDLARLDAGRLELRVCHADLAGFLRFLAESFEPLAERRRITFRTEIPAEPLWVWFDLDQLDKVFINLLANAFKFTPRRGRVGLRLGTPDEDRVVVEVSDTGPGIAPEYRERIFDRFFQSDGSARRRLPGTGLGLALAKDLVELHGGVLQVENGPDQGSTFTVRLRLGCDHFTADQMAGPCPDDSAPSSSGSPDRVTAVEAVLAEIETVEAEVGSEEPPDSEDDLGADRTTVLVVDDHPDLRAYVRRQLEPSYRVEEAADGAEGLACARELLPDLVVSDVMMPEMDGYALCRALKTDPELDFIPVILLTAKASMDSKLEGLGGGADDYLTKPFDARELRVRVDNLIASRRRLKERFSAGGSASPLPFAPVAEATAEDESFLQRVAGVIDEELVDESFDVNVLASRVAVGRSHLYRRLRTLTGSSPARLIMDRRLERAAALLDARAGSVSEVAYAVGFKSISHFSQRFRDRYHTSPSAYRAPSGQPASRGGA